MQQITPTNSTSDATISRRLIPLSNANAQDVVMTPPDLAEKIVNHFKPTGRLLDPCRGDGAFYNALQAHSDDVSWYEIAELRDFTLCAAPDQSFDWIITGPPFSSNAFKGVFSKSMEVAKNVVLLATVTTVVTRARLDMMYSHGHGMKEIIFMGKPSTWPSSGFMSAAIHYQYGYTGPTQHTNWKPVKEKT